MAPRRGGDRGARLLTSCLRAGPVLHEEPSGLVRVQAVSDPAQQRGAFSAPSLLGRGPAAPPPPRPPRCCPSRLRQVPLLPSLSHRAAPVRSGMSFRVWRGRWGSGRLAHRLCPQSPPPPRAYRAASGPRRGIRVNASLQARPVSPRTLRSSCRGLIGVGAARFFEQPRGPPRDGLTSARVALVQLRRDVGRPCPTS